MIRPKVFHDSNLTQLTTQRYATNLHDFLNRSRCCDFLDEHPIILRNPARARRNIREKNSLPDCYFCNTRRLATSQILRKRSCTAIFRIATKNVGLLDIERGSGNLHGELWSVVQQMQEHAVEYAVFGDLGSFLDGIM